MASFLNKSTEVKSKFSGRATFVDMVQTGIKNLEQERTLTKTPASENPDRQFYQSGVPMDQRITEPEAVGVFDPSAVTMEPADKKVDVPQAPEVTTQEITQPESAATELDATAPTVDEDYKDPTEVISKEPKQALAQSQSLLKETGHYRANVDGETGPSTRNAIKTFQYENSLEVTGELDLQTRTKLGSSTSPKRPEISDTDNPLLSFIAKGESGGYGAANNYNPNTKRTTFGVMDSYFSERYGKPLDQLTVSQVQDIQSGGYGTREVLAVGAYQMIPPTFNEAVESLGLTGDEIFNKELQDRIAIEYLAGSKRSKLQAWIRGSQDVTRAEAHEELAKEWASIPIGESVTRKGQTMVRGESYYKPENNVANAHTAEEVEALLDSIRKDYRTSSIGEEGR